MKFLIVGYQRRSGVSKKTGNPYDFTELHVVGDSSYQTHLGYAVTTVPIEPSAVPSPLPVPCIADITFSMRGRAESVKVRTDVSTADAVKEIFGLK